MTSIRILFADDHPITVDGVTQSLRKRGIEVICHAYSSADAVKQYQKSKPDVVVLDVGFGPTPNGFEAATSLLGIDPEIRIVFYTQYDQDEIVHEAYRLGARSFVPKVSSADTLADAIKQVHAGKIHFLPDIAERLALMGVKGDGSPQAKLDAREMDVFQRLAKGQTIEEIAGHLGLSRKTISLVVQSVKDKLDVQRSADITRLAIRYHIIAS